MQRPKSRRLALLPGLVLGLFLASGPVLAQTGTGLSPSDEILSTLRSRGYEIVENERTWLGRQRIVAMKDGTLREVVFIPATGEILRDYAIRPDAPALRRLAGDDGGNSGQTAVRTAVESADGSAGVVSSADAAPSVSVGETLGAARDTDMDTAVVGGTE